MVLKNAATEFHGEASPGKNFAGLQQFLEHRIGDLGLAQSESDLDKSVATVVAECAASKFVERTHRVIYPAAS